MGKKLFNILFSGFGVKCFNRQVSLCGVLSSSVWSTNSQTKLIACLNSTLGALAHSHLPVLTMAVWGLSTKSSSYDTDYKFMRIIIVTLTPPLIMNFSLNLLCTHMVDLTVSRINPHFFFSYSVSNKSVVTEFFCNI